MSRPTLMILIVISLLSSTACAKFTKGESENLSPFAEQTVSLIGTLDYSLNDDDIIYLRSINEYFDEGESYQRYVQLEKQVGEMLVALLTYSVQIVTISELETTDNVKANKLADVILTLHQLVNRQGSVEMSDTDNQQLEETIQRVRASEDYLGALRLMLPVVNEFSARAGKVLDELSDEKQRLASVIDKAIERKYSSTVRFYNEIQAYKNDLYDTMFHLSRYSVDGDADHLARMKAIGFYPVIAMLDKKKSLTLKEQEELHQQLTQRLESVNRNYQQMLPDIKEYHSSIHELSKIIDNKDEDIREARLTFIVWSRAYQKMASGKIDPAEWFDITETGNLLFGAARKAAGL